MVRDNVAGNEAKRNEGAPQYSSMEGRDHLPEQSTGRAKIMTICAAPGGRIGSTLDGEREEVCSAYRIGVIFC